MTLHLSGPSLSDFVAHRWSQANAELSKLDPRFVSTPENEVRLNKMGLAAPWPSSVGATPIVRLPQEWHQLLEACLELKIQADCLQTAAALLMPEAHAGKPTELTGKETTYHFRSWFAQALALAERAESVIAKTVNLFANTQNDMKERFQRRVYREITMHVNRQRQDYLHGFRRSWASGLTEDQLWETSVAVGLLPEMLLEQFVYPEEGQDVQSGGRVFFQARTKEFLAKLGCILHDLEAELGLTGNRT